MSFSRVKPLGWGLYAEMTSAEANQLDVNQSRAVDGFAGGPYSPANDITFADANSIEWGDGRWPKLSSRTIYRAQTLVLGGQSQFSPPDWVQATLNPYLAQQYYDGGGTNAPELLVPITNLIDGATMASCRAYVLGFGAPATRPNFRMLSVDSAGNVNTFAVVADSSGTYTSLHEVDVTAPTDSIDESAPVSYFLWCQGAKGAGGSAGFRIYAVRVGFTATRLTPGG